MRFSFTFLRGCMPLGRAQKALLSEAIPSSDRSTAPDAKMNLLLRFETQSGPRTVVASEITKAMILSGQYAEYIDQCTPLSVRELMKMCKRQKAPESGTGLSPAKPDNIVAIAQSRSRAI